MKYFLKIVGVLSIIGLMMSSCTEKPIITDPSAQLSFSLDTLTFDTVFTDVGSATRSFKVYNTHNRPIQIDRIILDEGSASSFRINIDGVSTNATEDIVIAENDSMYIFVEVTVDPNSQNTPYVISETISFETNGNMQDITLEAWGQNAWYLGSKGSVGYISCNFNSFALDTTKPIVIYGWLIIDSCELEIAEGQRIYVHGGLVKGDLTGGASFYNDGVILFLKDGTLTVEGTEDNPVVFQGDRLEADFEEEPGQWGGIWLAGESKGNLIEHLTIKNSIIGLRVDSLAELDIKKSIIHNTLSSSLIGRQATINAENCLFFSSSGGNNVQLEYGGNYDFRYCTMSSYGSVYRISHSSPVLRMTNVDCYDLLCQEYDAFPLNANFKNCIIYGSRATEIQLFDRVEIDGMFDFNFDHCVIQADESEAENNIIFENCTDCQVNKDPLFVDIDAFNYELDTLTSANANGIPINSVFPPNSIISTDLNGNTRDATTPDIGAYEYEF